MESRKWKFQKQFPTRSVLLLIVSFSLAAVFSACLKGEEDLEAGFEAGRYRTIVAFGDSIVEGYRQSDGWPEILGRGLNRKYDDIRVINAGISGDTAADGLVRLRKSVLDQGPDLVLISFGLNDMKNGRLVEAFAADLNGIVDGIVEYGAKPVLLTTTRLQKGAGFVARVNPEPFNEAIRILARERALALIDVYEEFNGYNSAQYLMDVAHPNGEGYKVLADIIRVGLIGE